MSGRLQRGVAAAAVLVLLVAAVGWTILRPAGQYRVTAYFKQTVGLYPGPRPDPGHRRSARSTDVDPAR